MIRGIAVASLAVLLILGVGTFPDRALGELYQYTDSTGKVHLVDDPSKIPPEYRGKQRVHKERFDDLSREERIRRMDEERRERESQREIEERERALQREQEDEEEDLRKQKEEQERARKRKDEEETRYVTPLVMRGNAILVPVTLGYGGSEVEAIFVLDTGAAVVTLHEQLARKLMIRPTDGDSIPMRVAGGQVIQGRVLRLSHIRVGGVEEGDIVAVVIPHAGPSGGYDGLLGMNFLQRVGYRIDRANGVIRWGP
jgi:clan AA aspartic protease (TIGR02281 family)